MNTFYNNNNKKALRLVESYKNIIYSYLDADPSKINFNHIVTIPASNRNDNNGWANFRFDYQEKSHCMNKINVRVETNTFNNDLIIQTSKVTHLQKSDLIIFPGEDEDIVYLSFLDRWGNRDWLLDKRFYRQETMSWSGSEKTYNHYNLKNLLANGQIIEVLLDKSENKIVVISNLDFLLPEYELKNDTRTWKTYNDYNIDLSHIEQVQFDGKQPSTIFWCTKSARYTENIGSTTKVSLYLESVSTKEASAIYQQLTRAYKKTISTGKAYSFKIPAKKEVIENANLAYDPAMLDDKGNIVVYVSNDPSFDVIENKVENITANKNEYKKTEGGKNNALRAKVRNWLKRHNNEFNPKWTEEEINIAKTIFEK